MKNTIKEKNLVNIVLSFMKEIMFENKLFINREYKANIGTIYKGSMKESNKLLRFKERFKWKYRYAYAYAIESMGR